MPIVKLTKDDMSQFKLITPPGKYAFVVNEVKEPRMSSNKSSNVFETSLECLHDASNGESNKGTNVTLYLSDKGGFTILELVAACEGVEQEAILDGQDSQDIELSNLVGKKFWADVTHREWEGNLYNDIKRFTPYDKAPY